MGATRSGKPSSTWLHELIQGLADLIYPPCCVICGAVSSKDICRKCFSELVPLGEKVCRKCGNPAEGNEPCQYCIAIDFRFDRAISIYLYEEPLRDALLDFKYHRAIRKGDALAGLLVDGYESSSLAKEKFDLVVPVPLTQRKKTRRSYNQSEVLAFYLSDAIGVPYAPFALMKKRETPSQTRLDLHGRLSNVEDSFAVTDDSLVKGKRVILVDDIITTGATASECAKVLKGAGARKVSAISLARGVLQDY
jgi:ComF family protein